MQVPVQCSSCKLQLYVQLTSGFHFAIYSVLYSANDQSSHLYNSTLCSFVCMKLALCDTVTHVLVQTVQSL